MLALSDFLVRYELPWCSGQFLITHFLRGTWAVREGSLYNKMTASTYAGSSGWFGRPGKGNGMVVYLFAAAVSIEIIYIGLFILTIKHSSFHFWPPPKARSWQFFVSWIMAGVVVVIFPFLGLLNFDRFILPNLWTRLPVALVVFVIGTVIGSWAYLSFGLRTTIGLGQQLIIRGPYRYTRNPQYIGDSLNILAFIILTNSWMAAVVGMLGILLNYLAPFTEEPWLEEQFGDAYREYRRSVPRFFRLGSSQRDISIPKTASST
jgi:protein-S-isoprenylcysteine O-methyltransferase Ste14